MKILVLAKNEDLFIKGLEYYLYGIKVYLDKDNMLIRKKSNNCTVFKYRVKNNIFQAYK